MYNKLLISAGGGIISRDQQAEQNECAVIALGLGGTGVSALRSLKKEVYDRLKPDKADSTVPSYSHIKFLAIDTDESSLADDGSIDSLDKNTEFMDISCADITGLLAGAATLRSKASLQWLKASATQPDGRGIKILNATAGAGGVRQIGRLLLFQNCSQFIQKLTNLITSARQDLPASAELSIHIFTGTGGGTGAGVFLDVCYLVQYVLGTLGLQGMAQTCGYFFLPDVNLANVADSKTQEYIKSNGFASMQELDYCMNLEVNGGSWDQDYGNGVEIHTKTPPVKLAHLITATNSAGAISADAYNYAMHVAVDYVMEFLVRPKVSEEIGNNPFTIQSHIANVFNQITMVSKERGACYNYCVLGASNAYLPYKEITTYLTSKIFEGFQGLNRQLPTEADLDGFLQTNALRYEDILKSLNDRVPAVPMYAVDKGTLYDQVQGITPDVIPQVFGQMRDSTAKIQGQFTANRNALLEEEGSTTVENGKGIASLIGRVKTALMQIAADPAKGPFYAAAMLHSLHAKDLSNKVDGFIKENSDHLSMAMGDMGLRERSMSEALRRLQNSNALNRGKRGDEYTSTVNSYYKQVAKIDLYTYMGQVLSEFKLHITRLYNQFFGVFETVMQELQATFRANLSTLAQPVVQQNSYAKKIMTIQDLQESLDRSVKAMQMDTLINGFVSQMLQNPDIWLAQDENKISRGVSDYFLDQLKEFTHRTMIDYLQIKFDTKTPETITKKVHDEILQPLAQKAAPLFWTDTSKYDLHTAGELGFCSIPEGSQEVIAATQTYCTANPTTAMRPSYSSDRISFLLFRCGVPLFGYKGVDNYRGASTVVGAHLYEGAVGDSRDWRSLYDITPYSCREEREITENLKERAETVKEAVDEKVLETAQIGTGTVEFRIHIYDQEKAQAAFQQAEETIQGKEDVNKARALLEKLEAEPLQPVSQRVMENIGAPSYEELSNRDLIISSQFLSDLLAKQLDALKTYKKAVKSLQDYIQGVGQEAIDMLEFANAMCTGVIAMENDYTFVYVKAGEFLEEKEEITTIESEPYGESLPLYSAFVNFSQMSQEDKDAIRQGVKDRKVHQREKVAAALTETKALIAPERLQAMANRAKRSFPQEEKAITKFLKEFATEVASFF